LLLSSDKIYSHSKVFIPLLVSAIMSRYMIIADPNGKGYDFSQKVYEYAKAKGGDFDFSDVNITRFRDGEIKPKIEKNVRERTCFFIHDSSKNPSEWFLELCLINQALRDSSAEKIVDIMPYLRFSRQDRKDESRVPISARVVADVVDLYADRVLTLDVHNPSIQGFYKMPLDDLQTFPTDINHIKSKHPEVLKDVVVMSTDAGGAKRASYFARALGIGDVAVGYKVRPKAGEVGSLKILGDVSGKNVLIVDDIIDSGKTLIKAGLEARAEGAKKVSAKCTHGLFTEGVEKFKGIFDYFFMGDTIKQELIKDDPRETISYTPLIGEAVYRISKRESLSELFK